MPILGLSIIQVGRVYPQYEEFLGSICRNVIQNPAVFLGIWVINDTEVVSGIGGYLVARLVVDGQK